MVKNWNHVDQIRSQGEIEDLTLGEIEDLTLEGFKDLTLEEIKGLTLLELLQLLAIHIHEAKKANGASRGDFVSEMPFPLEAQSGLAKNGKSQTSIVPARLEVDQGQHLLPVGRPWNIPTAPLRGTDASAVKTTSLPINPGATGLRRATRKVRRPRRDLKTPLVVAFNVLLIVVILISASYVEVVVLSGNPTYQIVAVVLLVIILSNILGGTVKRYAQAGIDKLKTTMHLHAIKRATAHPQAVQKSHKVDLRSLQGDTTAYLQALRSTFSSQERER